MRSIALILPALLLLVPLAHASTTVAECAPAGALCVAAEDGTFGSGCAQEGSGGSGVDYVSVSGVFGSAGAIGSRGCYHGADGVMEGHALKAGAATDALDVFVATGGADGPGTVAHGDFVRVFTPLAGAYAYWYDASAWWGSFCSSGAGFYVPLVGGSEDVGCPVGTAPDPTASVPWGTLLP